MTPSIDRSSLEYHARTNAVPTEQISKPKSSPNNKMKHVRPANSPLSSSSKNPASHGETVELTSAPSWKRRKAFVPRLNCKFLKWNFRNRVDRFERGQFCAKFAKFRPGRRFAENFPEGLLSPASSPAVPRSVVSQQFATLLSPGFHRRNTRGNRRVPDLSRGLEGATR